MISRAWGRAPIAPAPGGPYTAQDEQSRVSVHGVRFGLLPASGRAAPWRRALPDMLQRVRRLLRHVRRSAGVQRQRGWAAEVAMMGLPAGPMLPARGEFFNESFRRACDNWYAYAGVWLTIAGGIVASALPFLWGLIWRAVDRP